MIQWRFTPEDVARIRFAFSPVLELVLSLIVLRAPTGHALHLPWIKDVRPRLTSLDLTEVFALVPVRGIVADFLTQPPESPLPDLDDELATIRLISPSRVVADLSDVPGVPGSVRDRIASDPTESLIRITETLRQYWDLALAEHWPRIQALLEADVLWRTRRLANGGARGLFEDLHETITWHGDHLTIDDEWEFSGALSGEGILLVSSVMAWPGTRKQVHPYQPMIAYPVRGIGTLWERGVTPSAEALGALIGRTRAQILTVLAEPQTTTALARRLARTPGAISQHLSVLLRSGLVVRTRVGEGVLYHRSSRGDSLAILD